MPRCLSRRDRFVDCVIPSPPIAPTCCLTCLTNLQWFEFRFSRIQAIQTCRWMPYRQYLKLVLSCVNHLFIGLTNETDTLVALSQHFLSAPLQSNSFPLVFVICLTMTRLEHYMLSNQREDRDEAIYSSSPLRFSSAQNRPSSSKMSFTQRNTSAIFKTSLTMQNRFPT